MGKILSEKEAKLSVMIQERLQRDTDQAENRRKFYLLKAKDKEFLLRLFNPSIYDRI